MKNIILIIIFLAPSLSLLGQKYSAKGLIIDTYKKPISYVTIRIPNQQIGIISDEAGFFLLSSFKVKILDSLIISALGFNDTIISTTNLKKNNIIVLTENIYNFSEIVINPRKNSKTIYLGAIKKKKKSTFANCKKVNMEIGLQINFPQVTSGNVYLDKIRFYISKKGVPYTPFRLKIYSIDTLSLSPSKNLLKKNIIIIPKKGNSWVEIDITKYNIELPSNGCIISMEWLYVEGRAKYLLGPKPNRQTMCFGQRLSMTNEFEENLTWARIEGKGWINSGRREKKSTRFLNPAISVIASIK